MLEHVRERLLAHAVDAQADAGRELPRGAHADVGHVDAARANVLDERLQVAGRGLRCALDAVGDRGACGTGPLEAGLPAEAAGGRRRVVGPQDAEEAAHVGERVAPRLGDRAERARGGVGVGRGSVPAAVGLGDDHGERVRDDVVHLARDAGALGGGRELCLLVALPLEAVGAVDERGDRVAP